MVSHVFLLTVDVPPGEREVYDLVCRVCGEHARLHPDEEFVNQVRSFLDRHQGHRRDLGAAGL